MDLVFFDLDGTLLNKSSQLTDFTKETLALLSEQNIAYTVATGRTMLSARQIIGGHKFDLPHIYNNGVTIWDPIAQAITLENLLEHSEITTILEAVISEGVAPFINTISQHDHFIYHGPIRHAVEQDLIKNYYSRSEATLLPLDAFHSEAQVTNISMIGDATTMHKLWNYFNRFDSLIAYSGPAIESRQYSWLDVHHRLASKGSAVNNLKARLGASNIICFGDSDNDLSMFELADECYAPENANDAVKKSASAVIGHHHEDGVAHFLRERFKL